MTGRQTLIVSTVSLLLFLVPAHAANLRMLTATVDRVTSGDALTAISASGDKLRVRLLGIDAPEIEHDQRTVQPFAKEARDYLEHLIRGGRIKLEIYGKSRQAHLLAVLWRDQLNVNVLMVAMGYAEVPQDMACEAYCRELRLAEKRARRDRMGMWEQGTSYESPAAFRRRFGIPGN